MDSSTAQPFVSCTLESSIIVSLDFCNEILDALYFFIFLELIKVHDLYVILLA